MTGKERVCKSLQCEEVDRPPIWLMRQAGRYLPEYRALKKKYSFLEMIKTPDLACEVTMQPLRRFPLDAAILFSDILVIPEAMGQGFYFRDVGGIGMDYRIQSKRDVDQLIASDAVDNLDYVARALEVIGENLPNNESLLGFSGSPWTLATYMVEGGSSKNFSRILDLYREDRALFENLLSKLTEANIGYLKMQIEKGADAIQIFDSWAGICPEKEYWNMSLKWVARIIDELPKDFPIILYAKGVSDRVEALLHTGAKALSLDWTVRLADIKASLKHNVCLQGNLNPDLLFGDSGAMLKATNHLLGEMKPYRGFICNLGHGLTPESKIENVETMVNAVVNS